MRFAALAALTAALAACGQQTSAPVGDGNATGLVPLGPAQSDAHATAGHMPMQTTGDADRDFAANMIPHHQGAIDMARAELRDGKDPEMKALATKIIADQEREIAQLRRWLARTRPEAR